ncbi:MAG: glutathione S-transferase [Caulobacteraceae bacterium]|jgi:glutathione S-transferase|nr:glutathione S-transferase [Caulobacteraceae bacterium]
MTYHLYYWPGLQGRGEFVRLALEEACADYVDVARLPKAQGGGVGALMKAMTDPDQPYPPFAPPFLKDGDLIVFQTANILAYLAPRLGLAPEGEQRRVFAAGLQLTIADMVAEAHETHHPIASSLYYEDQKEAAKARAADFIAHRIPKYLGYFEQVLRRNPDGPEHAVGETLTTVDLSLFQLVAGLTYAFPRGMAPFTEACPLLFRLCDAVEARPNIAAYLKSDRRVPFNETGIFRYYPELDQDGTWTVEGA